jgi:thioesterase domain-containing protein
MQPLGVRPPFLCVGAGATMRALGLRLAPDQPFLSLQYPDFAQIPHPCRLEDIAAFHVATIRTEQPVGPYFLGGWCMDGIVAYEIAQQLRSQGEDVGLVVLFDVPNPVRPHEEATWRRMAAAIDEVARMVWLHAGAVRRLGWRAGTADYWVRGRNIAQRINRKIVQLRYHATVRRNIAPTAGNWLAIQHGVAMRYRPAAIDAPLLVFRRTLRTDGRYRDAKAGWDALARGGLAVEEVPGDHDDIFREPQVGTTAAMLDAALLTAQRRMPARLGSEMAAES